MLEISVKITLRANNQCSHTELKIRDMASQTVYIVSFIGNHHPAVTQYSKKIDGFDETHWFTAAIIKLYSNSTKSLDQFVIDLNEKVRSGCGFDILCHNCADAGNYTLNYFFPIKDNIKTETTWRLFKCLTFPICLGTMGFFPYAGTPPFFTGPMDVWMKAYFLSKYYGSPEQLTFVAEHKNQTVTPALQEINKELSDQIENLYQRKGQEQKLLALLNLYFELKKLNLSDQIQVNRFMRLIDNQLKVFSTFSSGLGKIKASMVQFFKDTGYSETMSETRILIGKLKDVIEKEAYPEDRRFLPHL